LKILASDEWLVASKRTEKREKSGARLKVESSKFGTDVFHRLEPLGMD
jgi:hypothetical protein